MNKKNIGVFAILKSNDKILLVKKNYDNFKWFLPGGAAENGEGLAEALRREIKEETGILVNERALRFAGVTYSKSAYSIAFLYKGNVKMRKKFVFDTNEISSVGFFSLKDAFKLVSRCTWKKINLANNNDHIFLYEYDKNN